MYRVHRRKAEAGEGKRKGRVTGQENGKGGEPKPPQPKDIVSDSRQYGKIKIKTNVAEPLKEKIVWK